MDESRPVLLVSDVSAEATAARLGAALAALSPPSSVEQVAVGSVAGGLRQVLSGFYPTGRPCIYVGPIEALVLALAPLLVGQDPGACGPVVAVTPDGSAVVPLLGGARGAEVLGRHIARVLGLAAATVGPSAPALIPAPPQPGRLAVVGLGPGAAGLMAPSVRAELERAQDIVGYTTYVRMAGPFRADQRILDSDNRREMDRARLAFSLAAQGRHVAVVSSGDPGVFAMAAAVVEALERADDPAWHDVELIVLPGISAAQAAAALAGAPLGHDFCVLSLSDNLKPWPQIEHRLEYAARADLVIALYNPSSQARPWQLASALDLLRRHRAPQTPVVLGRDVGRPAEQVLATTLGEVRPEQVDMRTVLIVGSSQTRRFPRRGGGDWVYTPRWYPQPTLAPDGAPVQPIEQTPTPP